MSIAAEHLDEYTRPLNGLKITVSDPVRLVDNLAGEVAGITSTLATVELFGVYPNQGEEWLRFQVACSYFYMFLIEVSLDAVDCTLSEKQIRSFREKVASRLYVRQYVNNEEPAGMLEYFLSYYTANLNLWYDIAASSTDSSALLDTFCNWVMESCQIEINPVRLSNNLKTLWEKKIVPAMTTYIRQ